MAEWLSHIGAYAWVENLVPASSSQRHDGGYVHAPSMAHAATAAVLRSAHLSHADEGDVGRYAFDLTSARVRAARALLDGVREGQPIGALLGYRFERFLQERAHELFLEPFRAVYPLVGNKAGDPGTSTESLPPRNVVDGLAIRVDWRGGVDPIEKVRQRTGQAADAAQRSVLVAAFADLDEAVDGVSDLLTAEGVFQITRGNVAGTSASIDALASGVRPPDPEVARSPRGGTPITHRLIWLAPRVPGVVTPAPWDGIAATPRAQADPALDRWVGELLGEPTRVMCWVAPEPPAPVVELTFKQLLLRPLDVLELARAAVDAPKELERRILAAAGLDGTIRFDTDDLAFSRRTHRTFPDLLETARQIGAVLARGRTLAGSDVARLDGAEPVLDAGLVADEVAHARAIRDVVDSLRGDLADVIGADPAVVRDRLRAAAAVQTEAFPPALGDPNPLATSVLAELTTRVARADKELEKLPTTNPSPPVPREQVAIASTALKALLGESFVRLCPFRIAPESLAELGPARDRSDALLAGDEDAPDRFIHQVARVRPAMAAWRQMWLFVEATLRDGTRHRPGVHVSQIPYNPDEAWVGRDFVAHPRPTGGRLSLIVAHSGADLPPLDQPLVGLVIDDWAEIVPNAEEQTGVAFHYDDPGAEAPQAVLIAVPPDRERATWSFEHLVAALRETFELAKIRAVEPEALGTLAQVLPATYLSANTRTDGAGTADTADDVNTRFAGLLTRDLTPP